MKSIQKTSYKEISEVNKYADLENAFHDYQEKAGGVKYVACFGKTFLSPESKEYKLAMDIANMVIKNNFGILHGGYLGVMEACSRGADRAIKNDESKSEYLNIGVPMVTFDKELKRVSKFNLPPAKDIADRKKALVELCDVCIVMSSGGFGTLLEALEIFHMNQITEKFGGKIRPLIFVGGNWKKIFDQLYENLDMNKQNGGESFMYFVNTLEEIEKVLASIQIDAVG